MPESAPAQSSAHVRHGSNVGQPLTRRDGGLKVTGRARYAADNHPPNMLHAVLAIATISRGRVTALDVVAAKAHPGVVEVMTPANAPALAQDPDEKTSPFVFRIDVLQNDQVRYANQPIAVVIAETLEAATEGAALLAPRYTVEPPRSGLDSAASFVPPGIGIGTPAETRHGDAEAGTRSAATRIEQSYETPAQYHNAMEPHAVVASWNGDTLALDTPSQGMAMAQQRLAGLFGIPAANIHIRSPFLGGGFGSKGVISGPQVLGIMAARLVNRPVKLVLTREQMYGPVGHRAPTRQTLRIGTDRDGRLTAISHYAKTASSSFDDFFEPSTQRHAHALCEPRNRDLAGGRAARHRHAAVHARARRGLRQHRARERDRRDGPCLRPRPAGIPAPELRRGGTRCPASRSPRRRCANATPGAPSTSAGRGARSRRGECVMRADC